MVNRHEHKTVFCLKTRTLLSLRPVRMTSVRPACLVSSPQSALHCVRFVVAISMAVFNEDVENVFLMFAEVYRIQIR